MPFVRRALRDPASIGVLFVMKVNPQQSTVVFASVADISAYKQEHEVLFSMHSVFRIRTVKQMNENQRLFSVNLALTNNTDRELQKLTTKIREETFPYESGWNRLGSVLFKLGMPKQAECIYQAILHHTAGERNERVFYQQLGLRTQDLSESEKALAIQQQSLSSNHLHLAFTYNNISLVYASMCEYDKARSSIRNAVDIGSKSLSPNHPNLLKFKAIVDKINNRR